MISCRHVPNMASQTIGSMTSGTNPVAPVVPEWRRITTATKYASGSSTMSGRARRLAAAVRPTAAMATVSPAPIANTSQSVSGPGSRTEARPISAAAANGRISRDCTVECCIKATRSDALSLAE
jgi:hypothetical protein